MTTKKNSCSQCHFMLPASVGLLCPRCNAPIEQESSCNSGCLSCFVKRDEGASPCAKERTPFEIPGIASLKALWQRVFHV